MSYFFTHRQMDDSHRVTVFSRDIDGKTALHIAARIGNATRGMIYKWSKHSSVSIGIHCQAVVL